MLGMVLVDSRFTNVYSVACSNTTKNMLVVNTSLPALKMFCITLLTLCFSRANVFFLLAGVK